MKHFAGRFVFLNFILHDDSGIAMGDIVGIVCHYHIDLTNPHIIRDLMVTLIGAYFQGNLVILGPIRPFAIAHSLDLLIFVNLSSFCLSSLDNIRFEMNTSIRLMCGHLRTLGNLPFLVLPRELVSIEVQEGVLSP